MSTTSMTCDLRPVVAFLDMSRCGNEGHFSSLHRCCGRMCKLLAPSCSYSTHYFGSGSPCCSVIDLPICVWVCACLRAMWMPCPPPSACHRHLPPDSSSQSCTHPLPLHLSTSSHKFSAVSPTLHCDCVLPCTLPVKPDPLWHLLTVRSGDGVWGCSGNPEGAAAAARELKTWAGRSPPVARPCGKGTAGRTACRTASAK